MHASKSEASPEQNLSVITFDSSKLRFSSVAPDIIEFYAVSGRIARGRRYTTQGIQYTVEGGGEIPSNDKIHKVNIQVVGRRVAMTGRSLGYTR